MVVIRLSRAGSKARPFYNIVVADKRVRRDGSFIERVGFYNPTARGAEQGLRLDHDRLSYWQSVGAQPSPTVQRLARQSAAMQVGTPVAGAESAAEEAQPAQA